MPCYDLTILTLSLHHEFTLHVGPIYIIQWSDQYMVGRVVGRVGCGGSKGCWNYSWNRQLQDWQYWTWNKLRLNFVGQIIGIGLHAFKSIFRFKNYFFTEIFKWRFQTYQLCLFLSVNRNWEMESETKLSLTFALLAKKKLCSCSSICDMAIWV